MTLSCLFPALLPGPVPSELRQCLRSRGPACIWPPAGVGVGKDMGSGYRSVRSRTLHAVRGRVLTSNGSGSVPRASVLGSRGPDLPACTKRRASGRLPLLVLSLPAGAPRAENLGTQQVGTGTWLPPGAPVLPAEGGCGPAQGV